MSVLPAGEPSLFPMPNTAPCYCGQPSTDRDCYRCKAPLCADCYQKNGGWCTPCTISTAKPPKRDNKFR